MFRDWIGDWKIPVFRKFGFLFLRQTELDYR